MNKLYSAKTWLLCLAMLLTVGSAFAQSRTISGTVVDQNGEPVPFASVAVPGSTKGVSTDMSGRFSLAVPTGTKEVVVTFVGFQRKIVELGANTTFDIVLESEHVALDEVVVIGYGTTTRRDLTGAVASVSGKELAAAPVSSAAEALTGKMAGVQVVTTEGSPDAEVKIRVRGGGSITQSSAPLYIVDGFPVSSINDIPANDIASMDVLKDASSTAIYGSRGANGVVIITTKSGQEGKITVNYNMYYGFKKMAKQLNVLDSYDYAMWTYEQSLMDDNTFYESIFGQFQDMDMYKTVPNNDWQDIVFGHIGTSSNHNLSISGGTDKSKFAFSYNRLADVPIVTGSDFTRNNLSLKVNNKLHDRVQLDLQVRWSQTDVRGPSMNEGGDEKSSQSDARLKNVMIYPTIPLTDVSLTDPTETDQGFSLYNPMLSIKDNDRISQKNKLNMGGAVTWEIIDNLKLKSEVGLDRDDETQDRFYGITTSYAQKDVPGNNNKFKPALIYTGRDRNTIRNTNTLQMDFKDYMPKNHSVSAVIGQEMLITTSTRYSTEIGGFDPSFDLDMARRLSSQGNGGEYAGVVKNEFLPDDKMISFFGRANYDFLSKYLISATFRADGSSKFSEGNRWGFFPSVSGAWRISAENFMSGAKDWLYDLKLRASYGSVGNNNIPGGQMTQSLESRSTTWVGGYSSYWAPSTRMANPLLTWETTITRNLGVDFSLLKGRVDGTVEVYQNNTKNLLLEFDASAAGYATQYRNAGETQNRGLEISANYIIIDKRNFGLTFGANIGFNQNKVVDLGGMENIYGQTQWASTEINQDYVVEKGQPIGQMLGYRVIGRYEVDDFDYVNGQWKLKEGVVDGSDVLGALRPGMMKLAGKDGSLVVTSNVSDRVIIGNANPLHTGGFYLNARAYGFDFSANFNWSYGNDIYNANKLEYTQTSKYRGRNMLDIMQMGERWTNIDYNTGELITDPDALAAANSNTTMWSPKMARHVFTDWAVEDGSFLRLNTLTLGYTVPQRLTNRIHIQNARFYVTAYNVWIWTNYSGFDPEVDTRRKVPYTPGVDWAAYPRSRQIVFGANITF